MSTESTTEPDASVLELLRASLVRLLTETPADQVLAALTETGWTELYAEDPAAAGTLFEQQGRLLSGTPTLAAIMRRSLDPGSGALSDRLVLPPFGDTCRPPGTRREDGSLDVDGLVPAHVNGLLLTAATTPDGGVALLRIDPATLTTRPIKGIDPSLGLARLSGTVTDPQAETVAADTGPRNGAGPPDDTAAWDTAVDLGRLCIATEMAANARAALTEVADYARVRTQFGRPIGSFQAVKHRLADAEIALQVAELAVEEGWRNPSRLTRTLAKILAGNAGREVTKQAQQVFGGIGFTWEHGFHRRLRRNIALDSLLGSSTALQRELGATLIADGCRPDL